jgi:hypothetical protein
MPLLLTASHTDDMIRHDIEEEYNLILKEVPYGEKYIFQNGYHPAVLSNDIEFARVVKDFLNSI